MKKTLLFFPVIAMVFVLGACASTDESVRSTPQIDTNTRFAYVDMGSIDSDSNPAEQLIYLVNPKSTPITIMKGITSCACMVAEFTMPDPDIQVRDVAHDVNLVLTPGDTTVLKISYSTKFRPGRSKEDINDSVTFQTDDKDVPLITINITGKIKNGWLGF